MLLHHVCQGDATHHISVLHTRMLPAVCCGLLGGEAMFTSMYGF